MRMLHYYLVLVCLLVPALLATLITGLLGTPATGGTGTGGAGPGHLVLGFTTAILCVATNTLLILFMIVSGRVLKAAMQSRALAPAFLTELNLFFSQKKAYPLAILAAFSATAAAVLGYGRFIGVPSAVHLLVGLGGLVLNGLVVPLGMRTLRANQDLLDRVSKELDRVDASGAPAVDVGEPAWAFSSATRWRIFALSAWGPYLYWGLVVWRGDFGRMSASFALLSALACLLGLALSFRKPAPDSG